MDCSLPGSSVLGILQGQEYWSGLSFPSPGDLPNPGIEPGFPALLADSLPSEPPGKPLQNISLDKGANTSGRIDTLIHHQARLRWPLTESVSGLG